MMHGRKNIKKKSLISCSFYLFCSLTVCKILQIIRGHFRTCRILKFNKFINGTFPLLHVEGQNKVLIVFRIISNEILVRSFTVTFYYNMNITPEY
jgi:hypothetical protein